MRFEWDNNIWILSLLPHNVTAESGGTFECSVATEGTHEGDISGVIVQFIAENGTVVSEIPVGNITKVSNPYWVNTTVPTVPVYVVLKIKDYNTPESEFSQIQEIYITADGELQNCELQDRTPLGTDPETPTYSLDQRTTHLLIPMLTDWKATRGRQASVI